MAVRVRFAPSPTGTLHIGSARTALYNWLAARAAGTAGTYILRIEDTDRERSTGEAVDQALRIFRWLGLDWDEGPGVEGPHGPYFQSERGVTYREHLERLLAEGHAYECYCTPDELEARRTAARDQKRSWTYEGTCRDLDERTREQRRAEGRPVSVRFRVPDSGTTVVEDLILGSTEFENALLGDFVIARGNGDPLYNFAAAVDDATMEITLVLRGIDHLSNTPRQILLLQALGYPVPAYAHAPMILGPDGKKLSKRHGAASVEELDEAGYIPEAVRNAVALLGWNRDDDTTIMTVEEMIEAFDPAQIRSSPAAIDYRKLEWINGQHLRALDPAEFAARWERWRDRWLDATDPANAGAMSADPATVARLVQEKVATLREIPALLGFLAEDSTISDEALEVLSGVEAADTVLGAAVTVLAELAEWTPDAIEERIRALPSELDVKPKFVFNPIRLAVTGQRVSPGLFESAWALGPERVVGNIEAAKSRLAVHSGS